MKGAIFEKLISISSPIWNPGLVFHTSCTTIPAKEHNNNNYLTAFVDETDEDDDHRVVKSPPMPNANGEEDKLVRSTKFKPDNFGGAVIHDQVQVLTVPDSISPSGYNLRSIEDGLSCKTEKFPPGGKDAIIFYTTSLRGIRKTFEDCNKIRFLLESFRVVYYERDVSMHLEYREELWGMLGGRVVPPKIFVKGRYVGGEDEVVALHERGILREILRGIPVSPSSCPCRGCAGLRFVVCSLCNGSRKVLLLEEQENEVAVKCMGCNENGLVKCMVCSSR